MKLWLGVDSQLINVDYVVDFLIIYPWKPNMKILFHILLHLTWFSDTCRHNGLHYEPRTDDDDEVTAWSDFLCTLIKFVDLDILQRMNAQIHLERLKRKHLPCLTLKSDG